MWYFGHFHCIVISAFCQLHWALVVLAHDSPTASCLSFKSGYQAPENSQFLSLWQSAFIRLTASLDKLLFSARHVYPSSTSVQRWVLDLPPCFCSQISCHRKSSFGTGLQHISWQNPFCTLFNRHKKAVDPSSTDSRKDDIQINSSNSAKGYSSAIKKKSQ